MSQDYDFVGGRVIQLVDDRTEILERAYVSVRSGRIHALGPMSSFAADVNVPQYDCKGSTICDGLVNAHMHFHYRRVVGDVGHHIMGPPALDALRSMRSIFNLLNEGVVAVRDLGHDDQSRYNIRGAIDEGIIVGPRASVSGAALGFPFGHADFVTQTVTDLTSLEYAIRKHYSEGADWIKIVTSNEDIPHPRGNELAIPWFSREAIRVAVETAHGCGLPIAAHANGTRAIEWCIEAGVDSIEHGIYLNSDLAQGMADRNIVLVPTLSGFFENSFQSWGRSWRPRYEALWNVHKQGIHAARDAGVSVAVGTDTVGTMALECRLLVKYGGYSDAEALRLATGEGRRLIRDEKERSGLAVDDVAEFIVLEGEPDKDVRDLSHLSMTILGGRVFTNAELTKMVPSSARFADLVDVARLNE